MRSLTVQRPASEVLREMRLDYDSLIEICRSDDERRQLTQDFHRAERDLLTRSM